MHNTISYSFQISYKDVIIIYYPIDIFIKQLYFCIIRIYYCYWCTIIICYVFDVEILPLTPEEGAVRGLAFCFDA